MRISVTSSATLVFALFQAANSLAHHSRASFDMPSLIEIRGTVVEFKLRSPHSSFVVEGSSYVGGVRQSDDVETWEIESESVPTLGSAGVRADTFRMGDAISILAHPHRNLEFVAVAETLFAADGTEYGRTTTDRIYDPTLRAALSARGIDVPDPTGAAEVPDASGARRIEGRWQQPLQLPGRESRLPLNEAGVAAWLAYDPVTSPINTCEPVSVPSIFHAPSYLFDIRFDGDEVVLRHEWYEISRIVPLDGTSLTTQPAGQFGTVTGRLEGDSLIVESSEYAVSKWGLGVARQVNGGAADVPSSTEKSVTEKFTASDDGLTLIYEYTLRDPVYLEGPFTAQVRLARTPDDATIYPWSCDTERPPWTLETGPTSPR